MDTQIFDLTYEYEKGMNRAAEVIASGGLVVFPTETVYGIGADALNPRAVREIFRVKGRPSDNPLIVHICRFEQVDELAREVSPLAEKLMRAFWPGPFTAVVKSKELVPSVVTGGLDSVGIRMPSSKYARELIERSGRLIAAPSANLSGKPSPTRKQHVLDDFSGLVPVILDGGESTVGVESTVCDVTGEIPVVLRPGGITAEMIESVAGSVKIADAVLNGLAEGEEASSPGMKYKHYSPRASVCVVDGKKINAIAFKINSMYDIEVGAGTTPVIFCMEKNQKLYGSRNVYVLGKNSEEEAKNLFDALRNADKTHADKIFFEAVSPKGMGLAVMNRIIRAAGFNIVYAAEEE